jgi:hypothetical protein
MADRPLEVLLQRIGVLEREVRKHRDRANRQYARAELWRKRAVKK